MMESTLNERIVVFAHKRSSNLVRTAISPVLTHPRHHKITMQYKLIFAAFVAGIVSVGTSVPVGPPFNGGGSISIEVGNTTLSADIFLHGDASFVLPRHSDQPTL